MKFAVIVFPGSNSDRDAWHAASQVLGQQAELVWHKDTDLAGADAVILPGGFAHGDYLRTGAIARFSPIMAAVSRFAEQGGPVLGICNGFQILLEAGLLPGAMVRNRGIKFVSQHVHVRVEQTDTPFTAACRQGRCCGCRSRTAKATTLRSRRCCGSSKPTARSSSATPTDAGEVTDEANPNGSRQQHRRHLQRRAQRRRADAAPRAGV